MKLRMALVPIGTYELTDLLLLNFDHQSSHLGTIMMIISLRLGIPVNPISTDV